MTLIAILATVLGVVTGLGNVPQIVKLFQTKSAKDLSMLTNIIFFVSSVVWLLYGLELDNFPLIIANTIYVLTYGLIILGIISYGAKSRNKRRKHGN